MATASSDSFRSAMFVYIFSKSRGSRTRVATPSSLNDRKNIVYECKNIVYVFRIILPFHTFR